MKGYERSKINLQSIKRMDHSEMNSLMSLKKNLLLELSQYQSNAKINKENFEYRNPNFISINSRDNFKSFMLLD